MASNIKNFFGLFSDRKEKNAQDRIDRMRNEREKKKIVEDINKNFEDTIRKINNQW